MSDPRLLYGIIGAIIGVVGAFTLSIVARWRESEKSRAEICSYFSLLIFELGKRRDILNNKFADFDISDDVTTTDLVKSINYGASGPTYNYESELAIYQDVFLIFKDKLLQIRSLPAEMIVKHYFGIREKLIAHRNFMAPYGETDRAFDVLEEMRTEISELLSQLDKEILSAQPRRFTVWLAFWIVGRA